MISGVRLGAVFLVPRTPSDGLQQAAMWPDASVQSTMLDTIAGKAIANGTRVAQKKVNDESSDMEVCDYVAYPLAQNDRIIGAVSLALAIRSEAQRLAVLQLLQWGAVWLEESFARSIGDGDSVSALALDAVKLVTTEAPLPVVGHHLCNLLADSLDCSRVAFSLRSGLQVRVLSLSHQLHFDRRVARIGQLEFAMEECLDQNEVVVLPAHSSNATGLIHAHAQLLAGDRTGSVCSVPLRSGGRSIGVLTLMRDDTGGFDDALLDLVQGVAGLVGPLIGLKQSESQSAWRRIRRGFAARMRGLFGPGHLRLKLIAATSIVALALLSVIQTDHRVTARSTVEGAMQQAVVAPVGGYLATVDARAGDRVDEGQVLAVLDDRDLLLEHEKWSTERDKLGREYQEALATRDRARVSVIAAQVAQSEAQLHLVEAQLKHTKLRAPFSGLLVSGDWSRALGAPVERGQLLFEIVPLEGYRVNLEVDEHDVAGLEPGQAGSLRLAGLPDEPIQLRVSRIVPIASAEQGSNHFRVEAEVEGAPDGLRPGMQGVAKVVVGRGSLLSVWTDSLVDRLRLWAWSVGF